MSLPRPIPAPRKKRGRSTAITNSEADTTTQVSPDTDFNLSALITSVERDIWVLEQLEKNSSSPKTMGSTDLPVPVTAELLDLPGYRPKTTVDAKKDNIADHDYVNQSFVNKMSPFVSLQHHPESATTPPFTAVIQHHHRRTTHSNFDEEEEPKAFPDVFHQRLMPKKNSVTNILYSRRLPSPPVRRSNPPTPVAKASKDDMFEMATQLTKRATDVPKKLFCPLCIQSFTYAFGLECHILSAHGKELAMLQSRQFSAFQPQSCPACESQFLKQNLLVPHMMGHHPDYVASLMTETRDSHFKCRFCGHHFLRRHQKLLMFHLEQKHGQEIRQQFQKTVEAQTPPKKLHDSDYWRIVSINSPEVCMLMSPKMTSKSQLNKSSEGVKTSTLRQDMAKRFGMTLMSRKKDVSKQSLLTDHQFIGNGGKELRFSIPEAVHHHYYDILDMDKENKENKRNRSSEEEDHNSCKNKIRQVKKRLKRMEGKNSEKRRSQELQQLLKVDNMKDHTYQNVRQISYHKPTDNKAGTPAVKIKKSYRRPRRLEDDLSDTYRHNPQPEPQSDAESGISSLGRWSVCSYSKDTLVTKEKKLYKCNLCELAFLENAFLLTHLKNKHKSTIALKPQYSCGACPAKFFKNSFLVRHCEHSHTKEKSL